MREDTRCMFQSRLRHRYNTIAPMGHSSCSEPKFQNIAKTSNSLSSLMVFRAKSFSPRQAISKNVNNVKHQPFQISLPISDTRRSRPRERKVTGSRTAQRKPVLHTAQESLLPQDSSIVYQPLYICRRIVSLHKQMRASIAP